jgi:hypothetical protein
MPMTAMRIAFTRGAARQFGADFLYYHAPNFGDTATTFTRHKTFQARTFLSFALRSNDGSFAFLVSQELLPLLHGGCFSDLP